VRAALAPLASAAGLGTLYAEVVDVATGRALLARTATTAAAPASTAKLLTAAAVLAVHRPADRIRTQLVAGANGSVVLVGSGDPTLSGAPAGRAPAYPEAARLSDLAAALRRAHVTPTRIVVDDSLFPGPTVNPAWAPEDVPSSYGSAITAVMADGGRAAPADAIRSAAPDLAAGRELAQLLGRPDVAVLRGPAPSAARVLATVSSAPIGTLVEQMLQNSDNVLAECLARQVALAEHAPASFAGAARAVRAALQRLGLDPGAGMVDGSGLADRDRLSAATLAGTVRLAAVRPALRTLVAALPVAAWSGTLGNRYRQGTARAGAGVVRAKTGTLTGVSALAGTVHDRDGRLLAFAFLAEGTGAPSAAESALDKLAAKLATL
jgi:D-alanyl-D-alanine carboxypeptidase/D-alanyl-D-alanine-endopeptidase (penicillin-binding protein 4)